MQERRGLVAVVSASDHKDAVRAVSAADDEGREQKWTAIAIASRQAVYYRRRQDLPGGRSRGQAHRDAVRGERDQL